MGLPHLEFGPALFPELASHWSGLKTLAAVFNASRETLRLPNGVLILLMHHPSMWNSHHKPFKERIIEHLSTAARHVREHGLGHAGAV
jgi:uracil-DNA glycosylase